MRNIEMARKIIEIAKRIVAFKENTNVPSKAFVQNLPDIDEIQITIDYSGIYDDEPDQLTQGSNLKTASGPAWPLETLVKPILRSNVKTTLEIHGRKDKKDDWNQIGINTQEAKNIILSLNETGDYITTHRNFEPPVDEYHKDYELPEYALDIFKVIKGKSTY